jgi:hypothetical protein
MNALAGIFIVITVTGAAVYEMMRSREAAKKNRANPHRVTT